jgi:hypothetical protein
MKFLFLDIDGVLVSIKGNKEHNGAGFPLRPGAHEMYTRRQIRERICWGSEAVNALKAIIELVPDLKIVISSTWRKGSSLREWEKMFAAFDIPFIVVGRTVEMWGEIPGSDPIRRAVRGDEIQEWLDRHPETTSFLILDDDLDMLPYQLEKHFIKTTWQNGLLKQHVFEAVNILGVPYEKPST